MSINKATIQDVGTISSIIKESNKDVAEAFGINADNCPNHPSFYNKDRVLADFKRNEEYYLFKNGHIDIGCIAFENPRPDVVYLNRLSVLPEYRCNGVGANLVNFIIDYSKTKKAKRVSIGIIDEHTNLKNWYLKLGFVEGEKKSFSHLPFEVRYMSYVL